MLNRLKPSFTTSRDRLVVRTLRCGRSNPGSNPGHGRKIVLLAPEIHKKTVMLCTYFLTVCGTVQVKLYEAPAESFKVEVTAMETDKDAVTATVIVDQVYLYFHGHRVS